LSTAEFGSYSPDGNDIAYVPNSQWEKYWHEYRGGQFTQIWVSKLANSHTIRIPALGFDEDEPMWVGHTIYFLSNRDGPITLFAYDVDTRKVTKLIDNSGFDITSASAGPGGIVYSQFGQLRIYNFATGKAHTIPVTVKGDLPQLRPHFQAVAKHLINPGISPNGMRAVFQAHGDILTVPTKDGSAENLTHSPGAMDRDPAWSPNGKSIAYFSDREGEYDLFIRPQGGGSAREIALGQKDAFYYDATWSPDSKKIVFSDQKNNFWLVDLSAAHPKLVKIARNGFINSFGNGTFEPAWSPDSRWIAYVKTLSNYMDGVFVYSLADGKTSQVTHGASDVEYPQFDANGKYLYFASSTDVGPSIGTDIATLAHPVTYHVYALTLRAGTPSPLAPRSGLDEEGSPASAESVAPGPGGLAQRKMPPPDVKIDFAGLNTRAVPLPIKPEHYIGLMAGKSGVLYLETGPLVQRDQEIETRPKFKIQIYSFKNKKTKTLKRGVKQFVLAADGTSMLYQKGSSWFISDTGRKAKPTKLKTNDLRVYVVPQKQWADMYHDAWRIQRAFFYNPKFDGLDIDAAEQEFTHYLPGIASREGLSFLFREMLSYMAVGHMFIRGGYVPKMQKIKVGLLGANYAVRNNHYRITRIFTGGKWNPNLYTPLSQPGLNVKVGDYVLAVNGNPISGDQSIYAYFEDLANKTVQLTVGPNPSMQGSHVITVKTISDEAKLHNAAWVEHNMRLVDKLSDGKLAYIYLPDTAWGGFNNFNRYFFSQVNKQGAIIDERYNEGGLLSDYVIHYLTRKPMGLLVTRWGADNTATEPTEVIRGPKVMVINQFSGSGGDALPWYFKMDKVGTTVGVRTWGGLVGIGGYPPLMDGGTVTAPRLAVEGLHGTFPVENRGIAPDVKVWQNPELVRQGHDPQLEAAVRIALHHLKANPPPTYQRPPLRDYHPQLPKLPTAAGANMR
jgi:tricorn protease